VQPALALIGQVGLAGAAEHQIVEPLEALMARPFEQIDTFAASGSSSTSPSLWSAMTMSG
jgi:hypothetical protein